MNDSDRIRERVKKLLAVASCGSASDAEIENAMRHAAALIDKHHIDPSEAENRESSEMGRSFGTSQSTKFSTWESALMSAVCKLFGCVQAYIESTTQPVREHGIAKLDSRGNVVLGRKVCFYGPALEANEATELFQEWSRSIATMGVARWGGCFRGDGAMYCYGFASAIYKKATEVNVQRMKIAAKPVALLGVAAPTDQTTAITLHGRYEMLKDQGTAWLKDECGVKVGKGSSRSGYSAGSRDAYNEGREHGSKAEFSRTAKRKLLS